MEMGIRTCFTISYLYVRQMFYADEHKNKQTILSNFWEQYAGCFFDKPARNIRNRAYEASIKDCPDKVFDLKLLFVTNKQNILRCCVYFVLN